MEPPAGSHLPRLSHLLVRAGARPTCPTGIFLLVGLAPVVPVAANAHLAVTDIPVSLDLKPFFPGLGVGVWLSASACAHVFWS